MRNFPEPAHKLELMMHLREPVTNKLEMMHPQEPATDKFEMILELIHVGNVE
jgi:hypothetical protein